MTKEVFAKDLRVGDVYYSDLVQEWVTIRYINVNGVYVVIDTYELSGPQSIIRNKLVHVQEIEEPIEVDDDYFSKYIESLS